MRIYSKSTDGELVYMVKNGDHRAFNELFIRYGSNLYSFVLSIIKDQVEAEEVVQNIFFKIWVKRKNLKPDHSFNAYLYRIAVNTSKDLYQKKLLSEKYKQDIALELNFDRTYQMTVLEYKDLLVYVDSLINKLSPAKREIFILNKKNGLSIQEISKDLNLSVQTVKNQLVSATKYLREEAKKERSELKFLLISFFMKYNF
ncbi:RNA polymerase sigma factor [Sunxiuqinia sp. A32]|uniref:RNA polymerase sigma factor n=1 Tax=Sunxiuqinia sp. A32 TaxID=3461496 RepID=UPI0040458CA6